MGTLTLDPKIHLDLTNKNEESCSGQRSKMLLALVSIAFNETETKSEPESPALSAAVWRGFVTILNNQH